MPRNPSEMQRLIEEAEEYVRLARDLRRTKSFRETALREVRRLEKELDMDFIGSYNGDKKGSEHD